MYTVRNNATCEVREVVAVSAAEACTLCGWSKDECDVTASEYKGASWVSASILLMIAKESFDPETLAYIAKAARALLALLAERDEIPPSPDVPGASCESC